MTLPPVAFKCSASFSRLLLKCHCPRSSLKFTVVRTCIALTAYNSGAADHIMSGQRHMAPHTCQAHLVVVLGVWQEGIGVCF